MPPAPTSSTPWRCPVSSPRKPRDELHQLAAAYFAVVHRLNSAAVRAAVSVRRDGDRLRIEIEDDAPAGDVLRIEDWVGALAGTLSVEPAPGPGTRIRVELPCGS